MKCFVHCGVILYTSFSFILACRSYCTFIAFRNLKALLSLLLGKEHRSRKDIAGHAETFLSIRLSFQPNSPTHERPKQRKRGIHEPGSRRTSRSMITHPSAYASRLDAASKRYSRFTIITPPSLQLNITQRVSARSASIAAAVAGRACWCGTRLLTPRPDLAD